jgi:UDP-glucose:glycoprotein glucosyltransferase
MSAALDYSAKKSSNTMTVVFNTRIAMLSSSRDKVFESSDLDLLVSLESDRLSSAIIDATKHAALTADDLMRVFSFAGRYGSGNGVKGGAAMKFHRGRKRKFASSRRVNIPQVIRQHGMDLDAKTVDGTAAHPFLFQILPSSSSDQQTTATADTVTAPISIYYLFDPLSLAGQRAVALMPLLQQQLRLTQTLILTPSFDVHEFPLQNYYRYVVDGSGAASFHQLPRQHVLTARVDAPEPWNIQTKIAQQDIDNLRCDGRSCGDSNSQTTTIIYELKNLLMAGQCYSPSPNGYVPPNGLQLVLQPPSTSNATSADTLVMQNLGYFQLQANPGLWTLSLAAGRASKIFSLMLREQEEDSDATAAVADTMVESIEISVRSFAADLHQVFVKKRVGMENVQLLDEDSDYAAEAMKEARQQDRKGIWQSLTSMLGHTGDTVASGAATGAVVKHSENPDDHKIHIFSLATGHVYERLLRIMMLSVTKRTTMPVKFWLFENYLSPTFKTIAAAMSQLYGFEVAYVTYKWPEWLHPQTQQQRIIWGYKILFLDVLFPLHLKKIIYVDADQVVRSDLRELWEHDLQGKPYGYVPFCSSRQETLGFQFWRSGYWADHLRGKPYHISALYVVDLVRFRRSAVGDQLRATYDGLARDPNSLSNLDQDLPNYAQHSVPIHSLPQEWLWCETWCSDASKAKVS